MLSTKHRRRDYLSGGNDHVAKFMPRYDGPYQVSGADHASSTYTLDLPALSCISPTFRVSHLRTYHANDDKLFTKSSLP